MKQVELTKGKFAIVDDEDYERITAYSWAINPEGEGYAIRKGSKRRGEPRTVQMHREVLGLVHDKTKGKIIDHINGNGLDNRKCNLRLADTQKNAFNKKKATGNFTSKYKGVLQRKNDTRWTARIKFNDRHIELGTYEYEELAAAVYNFASRIMFGDFRRENVSDDVGELGVDLQIEIYRRCKRYIERYGWAVNTPFYRSFIYTFKSVAMAYGEGGAV